MEPKLVRVGDASQVHDVSGDTKTKPADSRDASDRSNETDDGTDRPDRDARDARDTSMADDAEDVKKDESPTSAAGPAPPGRKGSKKVRSGCVTCKKRKVKCDETKPFCLRCTKTGHHCGGYLDLAALAANRRRRRRIIPAGAVKSGGAGEDGDCPTGGILNASPAAAVLTSSKQLGMVPDWAVSVEERRAFAFFQEVTAPCLAGDLDATFWRILVLQVCHAERAVRHAVLAVSSLHEAFLNAQPATVSASASASAPTLPMDSDRAPHAFALRQYNSAISCLLEEMTSREDNEALQDNKGKGRDTSRSNSGHTRSSRDTSQDTSRDARRDSQTANGCSRPWKRPVAPLMTCILFVCIEVMQGKDKAALIHLEQGRHILTQLDQKHRRRGGGSLSPHSHLHPQRHTQTDNDDIECNNPDVAVIKEHLVPLYTRLSMTSFLFGGTPVPIPASLQLYHRDGTRSNNNIPATSTFDSIHSLRGAVHESIDTVLRFTQRARPAKYGNASGTGMFDHLETEKQQLQAQLVRLHVALSLYQVSQSVPAMASARNKNQIPATPTLLPTTAATAPALPTSSTKLALSLLQIHLSVAEIWLATATAKCEADYDAHLAAFSSIVSLAAAVLKSEQESSMPRQSENMTRTQKPPGEQAKQRGKKTKQGKETSTSATSAHMTTDDMLPQLQPTRAVFTLETHVLPALYYVATKCRHRMVRQAALNLLMGHRGRRENLWRADILGAVAARLIEIEEGGFAGGVSARSAGGHERKTVPIDLKMPEQTPMMTKLEMTTPVPVAQDEFTPTAALAVPIGAHAHEQMPLLARSLDVDEEVAAFLAHMGDHTPWNSQHNEPLLTLDPTAMVLCLGEDEAAAAAVASAEPVAEWPQQESSSSFTQFWPSVFAESEEAMDDQDEDLLRDNSEEDGKTVVGESEEREDARDNGHDAKGREEAKAKDETDEPKGGSAAKSSSGPRHSRPVLCDTESPFGVPEHARIHTAVIGAEEAGGSWVTVFRKSQGLDGPWDVTTEFVKVDVVESSI